MSLIQADFEKLLQRKIVDGISTPQFTKKVARKLLDRVKRIQLYAHSYAFVLHFNYGDFHVVDLLNFAHEHGLSGISIHIDFGGKKALGNKNLSELEEINALSKKLSLQIVLEISGTTKSEIDKVVEIAEILNARNIRVYNRHSGHLSEIIQEGINELRYASKIAEENNLYFVVEQHEVLKSNELVHVIREVDSPRIGLLFDFGNMINANERPLSALKTMSPYIRHAHVKDVRIIQKNSGFAQQGVPDGEGDLPQPRMLFDLLMLGDSRPQVSRVFA